MSKNKNKQKNEIQDPIGVTSNVSENNENLNTPEEKETKNMSKRKQPIDPEMPVLEVDNSVNEDDNTEYLAWCNFTTLMFNDKTGKLEHTLVKKGDIVTPAQVPLVWIEQAVGQRFLISMENKTKWDDKKMEKHGYR